MRDSWCVHDSKAKADGKAADQVFEIDVITGGADQRTVGEAELLLTLDTFRIQWWYEHGQNAEVKDILHEAQRKYCRRGIGCDASAADEEGTWVLCEKCSIWRKLPANVTEWSGTFTCKQNPDKKHNVCGMSADGDAAAFDRGKTASTTQSALTKRRRKRKRSSTTNRANGRQRWVQCQDCSKWRTMRWSMGEWPEGERFVCSLNTWAPGRASCAAPEESYSDEEGEAATGAASSGEDSAIACKGPLASKGSDDSDQSELVDDSVSVLQVLKGLQFVS